MNAILDWLFRRLDNGHTLGDARPCDSFPEVYSAERKLSFEETVSHMARGYDNTQRVIQFLDAKAGAVVALSLAIFAFVGKVLVWAYGETSAMVIQFYPCWLVGTLVILGALILACGFVSLTFAFKTVRPNHLPHAEAFSTLFPAHTLEGEDEAKRRLKPIATGADCAFVIKDFHVQLLAVGKLVHRKISWLRISIQWLWCQGFASVLMGAVISWMALSGYLVKEKTKSDREPTTPTNVKPSEPSSPASQPNPMPMLQPSGRASG